MQSEHCPSIVTNPARQTRNWQHIQLPNTAYRTDAGLFLHGHAEEVLAGPPAASLRGKVDLIFTSPPFPLNRKKKYNNLQGDAYVNWLESFAPLFKTLLKPSGSIVMEVGNSWVPGKPIMSTLAMESLLAFLRSGQFNLCQQFVWQNPARLPSPAQWVTVERIRVKDSHTHLWWMSPNERPKADNRRVLTEYSASMKQLLKSGTYNSGARPSQHHIGEKSFLKNNNGAIPGSVIKADYPAGTDAEPVPTDLPSSVMEVSNTHNATDYQKFCRKYEIVQHPARMPSALAEFFIRFLTEPGDLVLDPFGGSNTTGAAAEKLGRRWITVEPNVTYITGSLGRFANARAA
jgi:DNA modification methylase